LPGASPKESTMFTMITITSILDLDDKISCYFSNMKHLTLMRILIFSICLVGLGCTSFVDKEGQSVSNMPTENIEDTLVIFGDHKADHFDFPVGRPDAKGYYNAQGFGKNAHLGDDWNGTGGGNSDLGDPIYEEAREKGIPFVKSTDVKL